MPDPTVSLDLAPAPHVGDGPARAGRLERALPKDAKALYELEQRCFDPGMAFHFRQISSLLRNPRADVWVLRWEEAIIGQIIVLRRKFRDGTHARIYSVTIDAPYRGLGHSRTLLLHVLAWLKQHKIRQVYLEVEEAATIPQGLYASLGFTQHQVLIDYYAEGRHGIKMRKTLELCP